LLDNLCKTMAYKHPSDEVLIALLNTFTSINVLCSLISLWLVYYGVPKRTTYIHLIVLLTIHQLGYDLGLFFFNFAKDKHDSPDLEVTAAQIFFGAFFGSSSSLFSLVIGCVLTIIVIRRIYFNLTRYMKVIHIVVLSISAFIAIPMTIFVVCDLKGYTRLWLDFYDGLRVFVVGGNLLVLGFSYMRSRAGAFARYKVNPVMVLMRRLALYPIVQVVARVPVQIYQYTYGRPMVTYFHVSDPSRLETDLFIAAVITVGFGGFGNMLVFVVVQPEARSYLKLKAASFLELIGLSKEGAKLRDMRNSTSIPRHTIESSGPNQDMLKAYARASRERALSAGKPMSGRYSGSDHWREESVGSEIDPKKDGEKIDDKDEGKEAQISAIVEGTRSSSEWQRDFARSESGESILFDLMDEDELAYAIASAESGAMSEVTLPSHLPHTLRLDFRGNLVVEMSPNSTDSLSSVGTSKFPLAKTPSRNPSLAAHPGVTSSSVVSSSPSALTVAMSNEETTPNPVHNGR
jgi:hypothetical protein